MAPSIGIGLGINKAQGVSEPAPGPVNTARPAISGTPTDGSVLTVSNGTWAGTGTITYARQWRLNGAPIGGATGSTYTVQTGDAGRTITATVTATDDLGSRSSTAVGVAIPAIAPTVSSAATISPSSGEIGTVFTVSEGVFAGTPPITLSGVLTQAGVDVTADMVGLTFTSTAAGSLVWTVTASNAGTPDAVSSASATVLEIGATPFSVAFDFTGQSNVQGTNTVDDLSPSLSQTYARAFFADAAFLNEASPEPYENLLIAQTGETIDGQAGPYGEILSASRRGLSSAGALATRLESGFLPSATRAMFIKSAIGGTPQTTWTPGGGGFNGQDTLLTDILGPELAADDVRISAIVYGQGEREAEVATTAAQTAQGTSAFATILPITLADPSIANWGDILVTTRRARREYYGIPALPFVFAGYVLPDRGAGGTYADNQERTREGVRVEAENLCRYRVRLSADETSITITDLGLNKRVATWDTGADNVIETAGAVDPRKDNNSYYIDARGYDSDDSLHHNSTAQLKIGRALELLMENIYGAGGAPSSANTITNILPIFYALPTITADAGTSVTVSLTASQVGTAHVAAYPAGSTAPTAAQLIAGTGATSKISFATAKRVARTGSITGLTDGAGYDIYALIVQTTGAVQSVVVAGQSRAGVVAAVPDAFGGADWGLTDAGLGDTLTVTISALPANNGATITDIEYQVNGGAWVSSGGTVGFQIGGLTEDVLASVSIRAVNAIGAGAAATAKDATPTTAAGASIEYLLAGGGAGGGGGGLSGPGGGGGGGAVLTGFFVPTVTTYSIVVGTGGAGGGTATDGTSGGATTAFGQTAAGGGGGGGFARVGVDGGNGGGGGGTTAAQGIRAGGVGVAFDGGDGAPGSNTASRGGGGGGGASAAGSDAVGGVGGNGGAGFTSSLSGSSQVYGSGGGGASGAAATGAGLGGTNAGDGGQNNTAAGSGVAGFGGGGGGASGSSGTTGAGAGGCVVLRYPTGTVTATGGTITTGGGYTIHTFTAAGDLDVTAVA